MLLLLLEGDLVVEARDEYDLDIGLTSASGLCCLDTAHEFPTSCRCIICNQKIGRATLVKVGIEDFMNEQC